MFKSILLSVTLLVSSATTFAEDLCSSLSIPQKYHMLKAYNYAEEHVGKGWGIIFAGIALQESELGLRIRNDKSKDYGVFQNNIKTVVKRNKINPAVAKRNLLRSFEYSAKESHKELAFWVKVHGDPNKKGNLQRILRSYNAGYNYSSPVAKKYSKDVLKKMEGLSQCDKLNVNLGEVTYARIATIKEAS